MTKHYDSIMMVGVIVGAVVIAMIFNGDADDSSWLRNRIKLRRTYSQERRYQEAMRQKTLKVLENHPDREKFLKANPHLRRK
jgi:hypothetical protein